MRPIVSALQMFCFVLLFSLFVPSASRAQTFKQELSNGRYNTEFGNTAVNVNVLIGTYPNLPPYPFTTVQGTVNVVTNIWRTSCNALSATFTQQLSFGKYVQHAVFVSKTGTLTYLLTSPTVTKPVHVMVTLTQLGTNGQGGFQIISDDTAAGDAGAILFDSHLDGLYAEYPFTAGSITINP